MKKIYLYVLISVLSYNLFSQSLPSYVPTNGLAGWWPFNGNANDESGNGNNGTVNGATLTTDRFGNTGKAYEFNSTSIRINNFPNSSFSNDFTICSWVYLDSILNTNNYPTFIEEENSGIVMQIEIWPLGTTPKYNCYFLINPNIPGSQAEDGHVHTLTNYNKWHNVVLRNFNKVNYLYVDGQLKSTSSSPSTKQGVQAGNYLKFGIGDLLPAEKFIGKLDDIGIWNRALTQAEITALYTSNGVGIQDQSLNQISIYPNPAKTQITITSKSELTGKFIKVYDALGKVVYENVIKPNQLTLNIAAWANGIYTIAIPEQGLTYKFVKE